MLVNLTPHEIKIRSINGSTLTLPPSGEVARLSTATPAANIHEKYPIGVRNVTIVDNIQVRTPIVQCIIGLPDPKDDVAYVVSLDVLSPGELIRNEQGQPVACDGLHANPI